MTDFVGRALYPERDDWIIRSLLDVDFYKLNMAYYENQFLADVVPTYGLINRNRKIPLGLIVDEGEFRRQLDHAMSLSFTPTETAYVSGMDAYGARLYPEAQIAWLKQMRLCSYSLERKGDQYDFRVRAPNRQGVSFWETIAMCILLELKTRTALRFMKPHELTVLYARATDKLYNKLKLLTQYPGISIVNFGTRRRHSFLWEKFVTEMCMEVLGPQFRGTSNVSLAMRLGLTPSGTNAHQESMQHVALAYPNPKAMIEAQYTFLRNWQTLFPPALRIELGDAYTTEQFYRNMPEDLAVETMRTWRGPRQDSGDPADECEKYIARCKRYGVDAKEKLFIFSDGLTHTDIIELHKQFVGRIMTSFGWGTNLTNDFAGCHPRGDEPFMQIPGVYLTWDQMLAGLSLVCKVIEVNGVPAVKLSNNPNKATGPADFIEYYKKVFGVGEQKAQEVLV